LARSLDLLDDPLEHPAVVAEPGPQERAAVALAEPVHPEQLRKLVSRAHRADLEPVAEVVAHVVATERQHGERVEAQLADRAGLQSLPFQSIRCSGACFVSPSHHTSPSSVLATFVKMQLACKVRSALGLVSSPVPGATPKNPASGLMA